MTTFEAVTAHWPKQARLKSTQRSRKSNIASSPAKPFTLPVKGETSSPPEGTPKVHAGSDGITRDGSVNLPGFTDARAVDELEAFSDEDENPFEALAMTQRVPDDVIEVNPSFIQRNLPPAAEDEEEDDPDRYQKLHEQDAAKHAEESARFRASQVPKRDAEEMSEYDDEELDELFRQTVTGGFSTPTKDRSRGITSTSMTPTSVGTSGSSLASRRARRDQRLRQQAGLGDLRYVSRYLTLSMIRY